MYPQHYLSIVPPFPRTHEVFVIMSFDARFDDRWRDVIQPAIRRVVDHGKQLEPYRTDTTVIGDSILTDVLSRISGARLIFCDVTTIGKVDERAVRSGNVMYELGIAHAVRQPEEVLIFRSRVSEISCVGHSMRSVYAPQTEKPDTGHALGAGPV